MTQLTTLNEIERHIILLGKVEVANALFVSCYLNLEDGVAGARTALTERSNWLRYTMNGNATAEMGCSLREINNYLGSEILPQAKGLAIFVRCTDEVFLLPMQFAIPAPNWIVVCPTPSIQPLVELRDCYQRHDGTLATARCARILEWM